MDEKRNEDKGNDQSAIVVNGTNGDDYFHTKCEFDNTIIKYKLPIPSDIWKQVFREFQLEKNTDESKYSVNT